MKKVNLQHLLSVFIISLFLSVSIFADAQRFVIPVMPDTQSEVWNREDMYYSRFNWVVENKDSLNIPFVLHVGDIVDFDNHEHWKVGSKGFEILDNAGIDYVVCLGNHDTEAVGENTGSAAPGNTNLNLRKTDKFNSYFPVSRFKAQKGRYEENKSDNSYYTFQAGGLNWLVVSLEFCARQGPVDWANEVVAKYPDHNTIILTHYHLNANGDIADRNAGYGDLSPEQIYDQLITKHPNILLVLSGHISAGSSWRNDKGDHGNRIYQIMSNYQREDYGGGYIRLLDIDTRRGSIVGRMYSPHYDKWKDDFSVVRFRGVRFIRPEKNSL